jgi:hypothetical protein
MKKSEIVPFLTILNLFVNQKSLNQTLQSPLKLFFFPDAARNEMTNLGGEYREKCYNFVSEYDEESSTLQSDGKSVASKPITFYYDLHLLHIHSFQMALLYYSSKMCGVV